MELIKARLVTSLDRTNAARAKTKTSVAALSVLSGMGGFAGLEGLQGLAGIPGLGAALGGSSGSGGGALAAAAAGASRGGGGVDVAEPTRDDVIPFLDLKVEIRFTVPVRIWIDCLRGLEEDGEKDGGGGGSSGGGVRGGGGGVGGGGGGGMRRKCEGEGEGEGEGDEIRILFLMEPDAITGLGQRAIDLIARGNRSHRQSSRRGVGEVVDGEVGGQAGGEVGKDGEAPGSSSSRRAPLLHKVFAHDPDLLARLREAEAKAEAKGGCESGESGVVVQSGGGVDMSGVDTRKGTARDSIGCLFEHGGSWITPKLLSSFPAAGGAFLKVEAARRGTLGTSGTQGTMGEEDGTRATTGEENEAKVDGAGALVTFVCGAKKRTAGHRIRQAVWGKQLELPSESPVQRRFYASGAGVAAVTATSGDSTSGSKAGGNKGRPSAPLSSVPLIANNLVLDARPGAKVALFQGGVLFHLAVENVRQVRSH